MNNDVISFELKAWSFANLVNSKGARAHTVMVRKQHICQNTDRAFQRENNSLTPAAAGLAEEENVIKLHTSGDF